MRYVSAVLLLIIMLGLSACVVPAAPQPALPEPTATSEPVAEAEAPAEATNVDTAAPSDAEMAAYLETVKAGLIANPWRWTNYNGDTEYVTIESPADYSVTFFEDGTLEIKADCNNAFGSYVLDGLTANVEIGPATLAACADDSRSEQFLQLLGQTTNIVPLGGQLFVILDTPTTSMIFDAVVTTASNICGDAALAINTVEDTLSPELSATLDQRLVGLVQDSPQPGPGAVMLIQTAQGRYLKSIGMADVTTCEPLAADAPYQIGSNTKMMTTAILFQLQEEGVLSISDPLSQWLPDLAAQLPYGDQITIDMLLTHTSGLYDYFDAPDKDGATIADGATDKAMLTRGFTPEELVTIVADFGQSYFEPAAEGQWHYSNTGYILLGLIIEKATGSTYEENLQARIFEPLGLEKTYLQTGQPEPGILPHAYYKTPFDFTTDEWNASQGWSAGAVVSTPDDFAVFLKAFFTGELFTQESTLAQIQQHTAAGEDTLGPGAVYAHGMLDNNGVLGHGGQTLGFQSDGGYVPGDDVTIVIWSNAAESNVSRSIIPGIAAAVLESTAGSEGTLSVDALRNATYTFEVYDDPITLTDGHWEGAPYEDGGASQPMVDYMEDSARFGDLDGDGVDDAVVFLVESGGGSGNFVYVAAQLNRDGQPADAGTVLIEDRIQIKSAAIDQSQVLIEAIVPGPGDGSCCPSHKSNKLYALEDGVLVDVTPEGGELVKISAADLDGTAWTLIQLADGQPVVDETEITIQFEDGAISGSAGCNNYNSSYALSEDNPFLITLGPVIATRMICPDPIVAQETAYLGALETVTIWGYRIGELVLRYSAADGSPALLIFAPTTDIAVSEAGSESLIGQTWQWVSFTNPMEQVAIDMPEMYQITFQEDGVISVQADCNQASLGYTDEDGALSVMPGPMTLALCGPDSRSEQFVNYLSYAARYFFQDGHLFIDLFADGGTMQFAPIE